jgi:hypothetical protein
MAGPLGVLSVLPVVATTEVEDVNGGPPGGAGQSSVAATTEDEEDVDGGPLTSMVICSELCKKDVGSNKWLRGMLAQSSRYLR